MRAVSVLRGSTTINSRPREIASRTRLVGLKDGNPAVPPYIDTSELHPNNIQTSELSKLCRPLMNEPCSCGAMILFGWSMVRLV